MNTLTVLACLVPTGLALYALVCVLLSRKSPEEKRLDAVLEYRG